MSRNMRPSQSSATVASKSGGIPNFAQQKAAVTSRDAYQQELDRQILRGSGTNELLGINPPRDLAFKVIPA